MAKATIKVTKYGDSYNTRYYTTWKGMVVSKRSLASAKAKGEATSGLIKSISKNNPKAFEEKPAEHVSGLQDPKAFLEAVKKELEGSKKQRGQNALNRFGKEFERLQRTNILSTEKERVGASFGDIMRKTMSKQEREELRRFMGWKSGFDLNKEGFIWNKDLKRFEKHTIYIDNEGKEHPITRYIYINYTPGQ